MNYEQLINAIREDKTGMAKGYSISFLQEEFCFRYVFGDPKEEMQKRFLSDLLLFEKIEKSLLATNGPVDGDFVEYEDGKFARICCLYGSESFQISNKIGVYVSEGCSTASGCTWDSDLDHVERARLLIQNLTLLTETRKGNCWTFSQNLSGGDRGVYFDIDFKVWKLV